jgi:hypothetical protein
MEKREILSLVSKQNNIFRERKNPQEKMNIPAFFEIHKFSPTENKKSQRSEKTRKCQIRSDAGFKSRKIQMNSEALSK